MSRAILYALVANAAIAASKVAGSLVTGSASLQAEAVHSLADCANQGLLFWGLREAGRAPTASHPLGHGRAIYFWSFIVAVMLFSMGGMVSLLEGWHKWHSPAALNHPWLAMAILGFGVVAESVSLRGALTEIAAERNGVGWWRWFRTSRQSELLVVFAEDVAALCGLAIGLAFVALALATGDSRWDAAGSLVIGTLLVIVAVLVGVQIKALLVGQSMAPREEQRLRAHLQAQPQVEHVYHLITQQLGSQVMVAVKARMTPQPDVAALLDAINAVERSVRASFAQVRWIFFEPDDAD